jgi:hypothetical protein
VTEPDLQADSPAINIFELHCGDGQSAKYWPTLARGLASRRCTRGGARCSSSRIGRDIGPFGVAQPGESPHELHIASAPPATKNPVMGVNEGAARVSVPGEERSRPTRERLWS